MPSFSPRTQQLGSGDSSVESAFEQGVTQQAYAQLESSHPELVGDVVALKVLRAKPDEGVAVAVFVLRRGERQLYVPVVVSDSEPAPLDMVHDPNLNVFVPLTPEWLAMLDAASPAAMGKSVRPPNTLFTDVDIRNIVVPPLTGRYSYAELDERATRVGETILRPERLAAVHLRTLDALRVASSRTKQAFTDYLSARPKIAEHFFRVFGVREATDALRTVAATEPPLTGGGLCVLGASDKASRFQTVFGKDTPRYFAEARERGYVGRDGRHGVNRLIAVQPYRIGGGPNGSDVYLVRRTDGSTEPALVLQNPIDLFSARRALDRKPAGAGRLAPRDHVYPAGRPNGANIDDDPVARSRYLVVVKSGKYFECDNLDVQPVPSHDRNDAIEALLRESTASPSGDGLFVRRKAGRIEATVPLHVKRVWTDSDKTRRIEVEPLDPSATMRARTLYTAPSATYGGVIAPPGSPMAHLPGDFTWVPLRETCAISDYVLNPHDGWNIVTDMLERAGARQGTVAPAGASQVSVDQGSGTTVREAAEAIAHRYYADFSDAVKVAEAARTGSVVRFYAVPPTVPVRKLAATDPRKGPKAAPEAAPGDEDEAPVDADAADAVDAAEAGADPTAQGAVDGAVDPTAGMGSSPADLATAEFGEELRRQMEQIQAHMGLLEAVRSRTQQIAGGAAPSPSTMTAMQGLPPLSQGGMPPGMQQGGMPPGMQQGGMSPGMDMQQGMGMPQGMGMQQGGMPQGMGMGMQQGGMPQGMGMGMQQGGMPQGMGMGMPQGGMPPGMQFSPEMIAALQGMAGAGADPNAGMDPGMGDESAMYGEDPSFDLGQQLDSGPAEQAGDAGMDQTFDAALLSSLSRAPDLQARIVEYLPDLRNAVDDTGRLLLTIRMKRHELSTQVGESDVNRLLDSAQNSFESLGELVIALSQNARLPPAGQTRG